MPSAGLNGRKVMIFIQYRKREGGSETFKDALSNEDSGQTQDDLGSDSTSNFITPQSHENGQKARKFVAIETWKGNMSSANRCSKAKNGRVSCIES